MARLGERLSAASKELERAREVVAELRASATGCQSELNAARSECAQLVERADRIPTLEGQVTSLQGRLQAATTRAAAMEQESARIPGFEQSLQTAFLENQQLGRNITELRANLGASTSTLSGYEQRINQLDSERSQLVAKCDELIGEQQALVAKVAELTRALAYEQEQGPEKLALLEGAKEQLSATFKSLANEILEDKTTKFTDQNKTNIAEILKPLQAKLTEFQTRVDQVHTDQTRDSAALGAQVKQLTELNQQLSDDAKNLTRALKGSGKAQGNWGEMILERMLEVCGLGKGRDYEVRPSYEGEDGRRAQPDVVINLSGERHVVVDSKASLTDYEQYVNATDKAAQNAALVRHIGSMRQHVKELSEKGYQKLYDLNSLDFVIMFVPIESAFAAAVAQDSRLWQEAWSRNVLIVPPSTLLFVLRTVAYLWRQEDLARNVRDIASRGAELYDKLVGFVEDLDDLDRRLRQARESFAGRAPGSDVKSQPRAEDGMTYIDTSKLPAVERLPGWRGRYFNSPSMTFAHYEFDAGSSIHEHSHPQEEVYEVVEGELEITISGVTQRLVPGYVGIVPPNTLHSVKAISRGKVIVVDYPLRDHPLHPATHS